MKKIFTIGLKDLKVTFRERAVLIMLLAPFLLTIAMGFITGAFSNDEGGGISGIPVAVVNQDEAGLGAYLEETFNEGFGGLFTLVETSDAAEARRQVEDDEVAAAVLVPEGFSSSIIPDESGMMSDQVEKIEIYVNPARPISAGIIRDLVDGFVASVETGSVAGQVAVSQLIEGGLVSFQEAGQIGMEIGGRLSGKFGDQSVITLVGEEEGLEQEEQVFSPIAVLAPSMAILFLIYTTSTVGGRSILAEREDGTLPRMLTTPSTISQVLGGKVFGTFLIGVVQVSILVVVSSLMFSLNWGDPLAVFLLILCAVAGATGWGILLASIAKTSGQVASLGTALMLIFGILGGSFGGTAGLPGVMGIISRITPNTWAQEGFIELAGQGTLIDILPSMGGLLVMAVVLFAIAVLFFRRRGTT
jgi:ABC-2 type transport system permease protein